MLAGAGGRAQALPHVMPTGRLVQGLSRGGIRGRLALALVSASASFACGSTTKSGGGAPVPDDGVVTWNQEIAPIVTRKCVTCHQPGGIAPMSLADYQSALPYAGKMLQQVEAGTMPPWGAMSTDECQPAFGFKDDPRLTDDEHALLAAWLDQGALEGQPLTKPLPKPASTALVNPDLHATIPSSVEIAGTDDRFVCFVLDPGFDKDRYIQAVQVNPGNTAVVHHVLIFADPNAESTALADANGQYDCFGGPGLSAPVRLVGAWAPGAVPAIMPPDVSIQLRGGSKLVMQVHYHPTRTSREIDASTSVDMKFTDKPKIPGLLALVGNFGEPDMKVAGGAGYGLLPGPDDPSTGPKFVIPPNVTGHTETQRFRIRTPSELAADAGSADAITSPASAYRIWGIGTHMHYVGRDMKIEVEHPDGQTECLLETPDWDFSWQRLYYYDTSLDSVPVVRPGDVLNMRCTYDNSMGNRFVRTALDQQGLDVPIDVGLGETTLDEMCLGVFGIALE